MSKQRGQISELKPGKFRVRFQLRNEAGVTETIFDEICYGTRDDAERLRTKRLYEHDEGLRTRRQSDKVSDLLLYWNTPGNRPKAKSVSEMDNSESYIRVHLIPKFGTYRVQDLTPKIIRDGIEAIRLTGRTHKNGKGKPLAQSTIRDIFLKLSAALDLAVIDGLIAINPCSKVTTPQLENRGDLLMPTTPQVFDFLDKCKLYSAKIGLYGLLLIETGFRLGEVAAVRAEVISTEFNSIRANMAVKKNAEGVYSLHLPKTKHGLRTVSVTPELIAAIAEYRAAQDAERATLGLPALKESDPIFLNHDGSLDRIDTLSKQISKCATKAGIDGSAHTMRHAHASYRIAKGDDIKRLQKRMGHSSPTVTLNIYGHLIRDTY